MTQLNTRPLVVRFGAMGDMVILTTLIRHLHARFGQPVDILASGGWARPLLQDQPGVGDIYVIRSRNTPYWFSSEQRAAVAALRKRGAGATWLADHDNGKTQSLLKRAGWTPQHWCHYAGLGSGIQHFCELFLQFAYRNPPMLGGADLAPNGNDAYGQLLVNDAQRDEVQQWLQSRGLVDQPLILIQVGNKRTMRRGLRQRASNTKYWPEANWATLLQSLRAQRPDHTILMLGVPQEAALNDEILQLAGIDNAHNVAHELPIPRLMALCQRAVGLISVDTGPAHLAAAVGCPVVTLFGKANPAIYTPRGPSPLSLAVTGSVDGEPSMLGITPAEVLSAWTRLMSSK
ncbi:MAG: glycosyltransferase family 9 protein [Steroidobacteraceae bacterium]